MADLVAKFTNRLEDIPGDYRRCLISAELAPRGVERQQLDGRRQELTTSLRPSPGQASNDEIEALLAAFPGFGMDAQAAAVSVALYADALDDMPTWVIAAARRRFVRGTATTKWDRGRCPTPPQVAAECREIMVPVEQERIEIGLVLDAVVVDGAGTPEERAAAVASWEEVKAEITRKAGGSVDLREREREALRQENARWEAKRRAAVEAGIVPPSAIPTLVLASDALAAAIAGSEA